MLIDVKRAWKDQNYRASLTPEQIAELPAHPAGKSWGDMGPQELSSIVGGGLEARPPITSSGYLCTVTTECPVWSLCGSPCLTTGYRMDGITGSDWTVLEEVQPG